MAENGSEFTKNIRLNRPQDIRRMVGKVINTLLQDGEMTIDKAKTIATAILDCLLHHATTFNIKGGSYRLREKQKAGIQPAVINR